GLGHMAIQYARAMSLHVAAVDVDDRKLDLARRVGAVVTVTARGTDPVTYLKQEIGGAHCVLVTAASPKAFEQALGMVRRGRNPDSRGVSDLGAAARGFTQRVRVPSGHGRGACHGTLSPLGLRT